MRGILAILVSVLILAGVATTAWASHKFIIIGTAGERGVYYPAGGAICRLVKRDVEQHGIRCFVEPSSGSVYNLNALEGGEMDLALAQTDWIDHAYRGAGGFGENGPNKKLRSVFSLHTEAFTVLARDDAGIRDLKDLKHKRIGIGSDGTGMQATALAVIAAEGWNKSDFASMQGFNPSDIGDALCDDKVDVILIATGHPNGSTEETTNKCMTHLVSVDGPEIDALMRRDSYYVPVVLPGHMYKGSPDPITTFGVKATLVTTTALDDETVYQLVKAVFDNLVVFKTLHPVFATLDKHQMVSEGLVVPLHPGALRYYREAGLIK